MSEGITMDLTEVNQEEEPVVEQEEEEERSVMGEWGEPLPQRGNKRRPVMVTKRTGVRRVDPEPERVPEETSHEPSMREPVYFTRDMREGLEADMGVRIEEDEEEGGDSWKRYQRKGVVENIPINSDGRLPQIPLHPDSSPAGITISGLEDKEITLDGLVHKKDDYQTVSLFLVNRRERGEIGDRTKDDMVMFIEEHAVNK